MSTNVYYDDIKRETKDLSKNMRTFHNDIKRMLLFAVSDLANPTIPPKHKSSLIDLACGQLGDLYKWYDAGIQFVWGIEINKNNLSKKNGAISRYKQFSRTHHDMQVKLTCMDAGLPLHITIPFYYASCQFALNYFTESQQKLDGLLSNVSNALRKQGFFVGTVIDGLTIYNKFLNGTGDDKAKLTGTDDKNNLMWQISREYPIEQPFLEYGQGVTMLMSSIGTEPIREYLVNFNYVIERCAAFGLKLITSDTFDKVYNNTYQSQIILDDNQVLQLSWNSNTDMKLSPCEKELSFMNRYFIFQKI